MNGQKNINFVVGCFIIAGVIAFAVLAFRVSGLTTYTSANTYSITAEFTNIGDLKVRAPVTVAGVNIGRITSITLDPQSFKAIVTMQIDKKEGNIPTDSTASILTAGLLGANYISIEPGFDETFLKAGSNITNTNQALILQNLIGQLMFSLKGDKSKEK